MLLILIPVILAVLQLTTHRYVFSALTTLSCAAVVLTRVAEPLYWLPFAALAVSAVGDYFMAHRGGRDVGYVYGIAGFLLGHLLFAVYAACAGSFSPVALAASLLLTALMLVYLFRRILPKLPRVLKLPVTLYTLVSLLSFACALMSGDALYAIGVGLLLFSDTMIAECDFAGNRPVGKLILPTYYLCHILVTLSILI